MSIFKLKGGLYEHDSSALSTYKQMFLKPPGKEFSQFKQLEEKPGFCIYFADPYSSMQRGSSENINGLIRQYFPKEINFRDIANKDLAFVVKKLNNRPIKGLNYQTPREVIYGAIHGPLRI